jgi:hypothetical protein
MQRRARSFRAVDARGAVLFLSSGPPNLTAFTVTGLTEAEPGETFCCKWQHTYSKRTKIPEGLGFWILLAARDTDSFGTTRWEISAVKESERGRDKAVFISATQSSNEISTPVARAADVVIEGSIVTNPDATNGVQKFRIILKAFEAVLGYESVQLGEVTYLALFLASDESSFITGANIVIVGGLTTWV